MPSQNTNTEWSIERDTYARRGGPSDGTLDCSRSLGWEKAPQETDGLFDAIFLGRRGWHQENARRITCLCESVARRTQEACVVRAWASESPEGSVKPYATFGWRRWFGRFIACGTCGEFKNTL